MKTNNEKSKEQNNWVLEVLQLSEANPGLRILSMVNGNEWDNEYPHYAGSFGQPSIDEVYVKGKRTYFRSSDAEELVEYTFERLADTTDSVPSEALERQAREEVCSLNWEKVIVVKIEIP